MVDGLTCETKKKGKKKMSLNALEHEIVERDDYNETIDIQNPGERLTLQKGLYGYYDKYGTRYEDNGNGTINECLW